MKNALLVILNNYPPLVFFNTVGTKYLSSSNIELTTIVLWYTISIIIAHLVIKFATTLHISNLILELPMEIYLL